MDADPFLQPLHRRAGCWFYSEALGEYSFSENLTALAYLAAALLLWRDWRKHGGRPLLAAALLNVWLLLEEINYGQIFFAASKTNYYFDEDQLSLHTALLRPVRIGKWDLADAAALVLIVGVTAAVPAVLRRYYKVKGPLYVLALPAALALFACAGNLAGFLVPWACGYDSFEEITETLQATSSLYFAFLLHLHLRNKRYN